MTDLKWREGPLLPDYLEDVAAVQLGDGFLAIGGYSLFSSLSVDTIYKFHQETYEWTLLEESLSLPRQMAAASGIPDDFFYC